MRHGKKVNHLGRKAAHRKAMLANMACSLIEHKRINTPVAKAKALKVFIEPLITKCKLENNQTAEKGMHNRRIVFKNLRNKYAITELFGNVADKVGDRPGGYTRIIKLGNRLGDNADMAMIELVDFNETYSVGGQKTKKSTRRSRSKKSGSATEEAKAENKSTEESVAEPATEPQEKPAPEAQAETTKKEESADLKKEPETKSENEPKKDRESGEEEEKKGDDAKK